MNIKHSIGLNLSADAIPGRLHMVQGDANSRTIVATLWDGAQLYSIPAGAAIMVRFRKPDGTGGLYDATESGSEVSYASSIVTAPVATQMLAVAGDVFAEIDIFGSSSGAAAERLATFRFIVEVSPCVLPDAQIISSDYYNILASDIADAKAAADLAKNYAASAKQSADSAAASVEGAVKYNAPQTLTDEQKQQARENINAPAPYTAGENISISGSIIATKAFPCNPNLLDNWYFGNPVNQRGASYVENNYGLDRWKGTYGVNANGTMGFNSSGFAIQGLEDSVKNILDGMMLTASILYVNGTLHTGTDVYTKTGDAHNFIGDGNIQLNNQADGNILLYAQSADQIKAVKLEPGSQQTLAHQENGVWALNEIPDYGEQLRRCQRYYYRVHYAQYQTINMAYEDSAYAFTMLPLPVAMRIDNPVLTQSKPIALGSSEKIMTSAEAEGCMARLGVNYATVSNPTKAAYSYCADPEGVTFTLSADL